MNLEKALHVNFTIVGNDVDMIDFYNYLGSLPEDWDFEVTSSNVNLYANKIKDTKTS